MSTITVTVCTHQFCSRFNPPRNNTIILFPSDPLPLNPITASSIYKRREQSFFQNKELLLDLVLTRTKCILKLHYLNEPSNLIKLKCSSSLHRILHIVIKITIYFLNPYYPNLGSRPH